jgi:two-component system nitrate/nitrite response regulator NarL
LTAPTRLFVCDDHPIVIDGVSSLFRNHHSVELVGSCAWDEKTIECVRQSRADVFFFDYTQLSGSGLSARNIGLALPKVRLVVFAESFKLVETMQALDDGAAGIVLKSSPLEEVETAVLRVASGDNYLDEMIVKNLAFFTSRSLGDHYARN